MQRRGVRFWLLWSITLVSFSAGCTASNRVNNCIAGAIVGAGVGAAIGAGTGGNNHEHSDNAMLGAGIGAVVGGALGCLLTKEEVEAAPPPPPAPPPAPPAEPEPAPPAPAPRRIILRGVNFDYDKSNIKSQFVPILDEAAQTLKDNPDITVSVEGHTDSIGSDEYNQRLSERRAQAVKQYLVSKGIASSRLSTVGKGELEPIASNTEDGRDNPEGRAMNRRAELKIQ
jgi:outer membrane protein OmpA-like peptidoglycan-associated protein